MLGAVKRYISFHLSTENLIKGSNPLKWKGSMQKDVPPNIIRDIEKPQVSMSSAWLRV